MGTDKAWLSLGGRALIERAVERASGQASPLAIAANDGVERLRALGCPVVPDAAGHHGGPLAGVLGGMGWARERSPAATHVASFACDTPFFPLDLIARLEAGVRGQSIAVARSCGRLHPVFALWPLSIEHALLDCMGAERSPSLHEILERFGVCAVDFEIRGVDPFFNVNTPGDLASAESMLAGA